MLTHGSKPLSERDRLLQTAARLTEKQWSSLDEETQRTIQLATAAKEAESLSYVRFCHEILELQGSPLVEAIWAVSEGDEPSTITPEQCREFFGCWPSELPLSFFRTVAVRAGGRGGKTSRLVATKALHASWTVPVPNANPGENPVALIIAPDLALARQSLSFVKGYVDASPTLRAAKVAVPTTNGRKPQTTNRVSIRRPDGMVIDILIRAASRGGKGGRSYTLVFAALDEACFFLDDKSGDVNDKEMYRAVIQRIEPGGQCWITSTPWIEKVGLLEETFEKNFGTHEHALCVQAPTRALNPAWDPDGSIERDMREDDPDNAEREIDAIPLAGGSHTYFADEAIKRAINVDREQELPLADGWEYFGGGDFAFKRNSSVVAVVARKFETLRTGRRVALIRLACIDELKPGAIPLVPGEVVDRFAIVLKRYGIGVLMADDHERREVNEHLERNNIRLVPAPRGNDGKAESYAATRTVLHEGRLELPDNARLKRQMRSIVAKPAPGGGLVITSPRKTTGINADGSHGDMISAVVLAVFRAVTVAIDNVPLPEVVKAKTPEVWGPARHLEVPGGMGPGFDSGGSGDMWRR